MLPRLVLFVVLLAAMPAQAGRLTVRIEHRWRGQPLPIGALALRNDAGNELSVTRLAYLLSAVRLRRADGSWLGANDWFAFVNAAAPQTELALGDIPPGRYSALRFDLGLDAATDASDPAQRPPGHPLHPDVNGLHWSWRKGYIFLALEGRWQPPDGTPGGYSYHLAGETCRGTVEVPADLDLSGNVLITLFFDADRLFSAQHRLDIAASTSTHSRDDAGLAAQFADNAVRAFVVAKIEPDLRPVETGKTSTVTLPGGLGVKVPAHFPQANWPADNLSTAAGIALGQRLFHEPRLSINNSQSCASCHDPSFALADPRPTSAGAEGQRGVRNALPLFNLAWKPAFFWDGRAPSIRAQVLQPIQDPQEMHETLDHVLAKLGADAEYPAAFERTFGSREITADRLARALEQYLLTLISADAKMDRLVRGAAELTAEEHRGFELFFTESDPARGIRGADCFHCHGGANFTNYQFLNNGLDADGARTDAGRQQFTGTVQDAGRFMVPSLRNVALTAPYMHDGRFKTLDEVLEHYDHGVQPSATLDPNLAKHLPYGGLHLTAEEKSALLAFLRTLTDDGFARPAR
jgi:cytochrome c peroxidase